METIRSSREISDLFNSANSFSNRYISLLVKRRSSKNDPTLESNEHDLYGRVAFIAGKKHGNAVWRNSAKRRMREICRQLGGPWSDYDVIFIAKPRILKQSYSKVLQECERTLKMSCVTYESSIDE